MKLDECIKKIERYLGSTDYSPRLVNVQNPEDLSAIVDKFNVGNNRFISVASYAGKDETPRLDDLQSMLSSIEENAFLTGLTTWMRLLGDAALLKELENFAAATFNAHIVVLCYQAEERLRFKDSRARRLVYDVEGIPAFFPEIVFRPPTLPVPATVTCIEGIENIPAAVEKMSNGKLYVKTNKHKKNFPDSLLLIKEESKAFEALKNKDVSTNALSMDNGSDDQWIYALQEMEKAGSWGNLFVKNFGISTNFSLIVNAWKGFDENKKWLYFIALKMNKDEENWCLNTAVSNSESMSKLIRNVYRSLLKVEPNDPTFWDKYNERKNLIESLGSSATEVDDYLQMIKSKESKALYYLTDGSKKEKEYVFEFLAQYSEEYSRDEVMDILLHVYPDLYIYLSPYRFKNETMNQYFQDYKYQKVINKIYPEFKAVVEEQAKKREYNLWLSPRAEKIEELNKENSRLYFVDAMGVEYLSFIISRCKDMNLMADVTVCRCELPSITKFNKEFLESFTNIAPDIKRLDEMKHHGEESFDYQNTKLPFHLIQELEIIDGVIADIYGRLLSGSIDRAYMIADHGASRLAVINEHENQWEMASKGEHSGRCCPKDEADVQSEYATEANGFWVLANYDRFKGGRKANIEVHGGAALEEVTVPIIELTLITEEIEISINSKLPIEVSYRKKAELQLFSKTKIGNVTVRINGNKIVDKFYDAEPQGNNLYLVRMPEVKNKGTYSLTVYTNGNSIAELEFTVEKEGSREKKLL